jgi:hypothetical protein
MKNQPPLLKVGTPCPKQWDDMTGDAKRRFCEHCHLHVHNLSAMSAAEQKKLVTESGGKACITYTVRLDGTMISERFWFRFFRPLRFAGATVLATLLPFWFASCSTRRTASLGKPQRLTGEAPTVQTQENGPGKKLQGPQVMLGTPAPFEEKH